MNTPFIYEYTILLQIWPHQSVTIEYLYYSPLLHRYMYFPNEAYKRASLSGDGRGGIQQQPWFHE